MNQNEEVHKILVEAGSLLKCYYEEAPKWDEKGRFDLVSEADLAAERLIVTRLRSAFPGEAIYAEEAGEDARDDDRDAAVKWIVDPLDGTANFVAGIPHFAVSIARERDGHIAEGYVYNPISEELFYSTRSEGRAYLRDDPITVSETADLGAALVAFGFSANMDTIRKYYERWGPVFEGCRKGLAVIVPSLTLCNVARGRLDAFIDFACSMEGQAAAALIVKNAGGVILNYDLTRHDHRTKGAVAANPRLADVLRQHAT